MKVTVVGSGMMGSGIAARAALAGHTVLLQDISSEKANAGRKRAAACLDELQENGLTDGDSTAAIMRIVPETDLKKAVDGTDLVLEAVFEDIALKQQVFEELDQLTPQNVPLLSNTSGLRITDIAAKVRRFPERTMTAHFWLPAHLVPLVEIVLWEKTSRPMAQKVKDELSRWGKAPVLVNRDLPGQLANRILQAIIREATSIVDMGLASAEDVDTAIKMGMGIRFPAYGPLEHIDVIGLDLAASIQRTVLPEIASASQNVALDDKVANGELGAKSGKGYYDWGTKSLEKTLANRDAFIISALKLLSEQEKENET